MTESYFVGTEESPYHLSVGAVVLNDKNEVCTHYFDDFKGIKDFHILMRETIEPEESIEQAVARGLMEEFGMTAKLETYLGSLVANSVPIRFFQSAAPTSQKTTLYFLTRLLTYDETMRRVDDPESGSTITWTNIDTLIAKIKEQASRISHPTIDESEVLERTKLYLAR